MLFSKVANGGQADSKLKNLPVPVYLRPLDEKDASMKVRLFSDGVLSSVSVVVWQCLSCVCVCSCGALQESICQVERHETEAPSWERVCFIKMCLEEKVAPSVPGRREDRRAAWSDWSRNSRSGVTYKIYITLRRKCMRSYCFFHALVSFEFASVACLPSD